MKLSKVDVIVVTQYFGTLNQFPDKQLEKFNGSAYRNRVSNVSESTRIHS